jgi:cell division protein FtsI/penicillin-binding protein 2
VKKRDRRIRLYVIGVVFVAITIGLWGRLVQVQYVRSDYYSSLSQKQMITTKPIQPVRGGIFDRHGRPLALSVRLNSVFVNPSEVTSPRRVEKVASKALGLSRGEIRRKLRSAGTFVWLKRKCELSQKTKDLLAGLDGVGVTLEQGRVYPYGATAAKLVGFVGVDNQGMAGVEAACEEILRGIPGSAKVVKNGKYIINRYYKFVENDPHDGKHVYLTIDAAIQEIAEDRLAAAVGKHGATSGAIIVMAAKSGELLALAEYPGPAGRTGSQLRDSLWTVRSVSHVYEPGSTFKLVTAAALLDRKLVAPVDSFDAENGRADLGVAIIKDPHPHGWITFEEAFVYSSNIVTYKASDRIPADDFYRYIRMFGFGEKTGISLSGESPGSIAPVDQWSGRTRGTIAFGQEIAVTPLQMVAAFGVVPNDGVMVLPRLVKGIADESSGKITKSKTVKVRRVIARSTARTLREFCRRTVADGTGETASVPFMDLSGKTGTAQKASPRGGYRPGKYVSSFVGYAPHDNPRIICMVMLDEPKYASRYGGISCAPVFAGLCEEIANTSTVFNGVMGERHISPAEPGKNEYRAPNFIRMDRAVALEHARNLGCNVLCQGEEGRVVAQTPDPGMPMDRDGVIRLLVTPPKTKDGKRKTTPDLIGLPVREAKAVAARSGFRCVLVGSGVVKKQKPRPGLQSGDQLVRLYCDATGSSSGSAGRRSSF